MNRQLKIVFWKIFFVKRSYKKNDTKMKMHFICISNFQIYVVLYM